MKTQKLSSQILKLTLKGIVKEYRSLAENNPLNLLHKAEGRQVFEKLQAVDGFDQNDFVELVNSLLDETE